MAKILLVEDNEINRDISLQRPPREETQNPRGLRFIKAGKIFWLKLHRTVSTYRGTTPQSCDRASPARG